MTDDRIAKLEATINAAQRELAEIKAGRPAPPPPPARDEVRIITLNTERGSDGLPSLAELQKLYSAVRHRVPEQKSRDPDAGFRGFLAAYRYISNCGRTSTLNGKVSITWWLDGMRDWLRERNAMTLDVTGSSFIAAMYASGDILFSPHDSARGNVWEFGLVPPGHSGGKPASADGWRRIAREGASAILPPSSPSRGFQPQSQVRVVVGGY